MKIVYRWSCGDLVYLFELHCKNRLFVFLRVIRIMPSYNVRAIYRRNNNYYSFMLINVNGNCVVCSTIFHVFPPIVLPYCVCWLRWNKNSLYEKLFLFLSAVFVFISFNFVLFGAAIRREQLHVSSSNSFSLLQSYCCWFLEN